MIIKTLDAKPYLSKGFFEAKTVVIKDDEREIEVRMRAGIKWLMDELRTSTPKDPQISEWFKREMHTIDQRLLLEDEVLLVWRNGKWRKIIQK